MEFSEFKNIYQKKRVRHYPHRVKQPPVLSVLVHTYNHSIYIKQCLDSIILQQTNFPFEIIIGEDQSTDGTREVCIEYADKYPQLIRLFLHTDANKRIIGGQKTGRFNLHYNLYNCRGKYIALCDGDDYWIDPYKLQKQVDYMEGHPECSMCFHPAYFLKKGLITKKIYRLSKENTILKETDKFQVLNTKFAPTASLFFKTDHIKKLPEWVINSPTGDIALKLLLLSKGKLGYINKPMAVYRVNVAGSWSRSIQYAKERKIQLYLDLIYLLHQFNNYTNYKYIDEIIKRQANLLSKVIKYQNVIQRFSFLKFWIRHQRIFLKFPFIMNIKILIMIFFAPIIELVLICQKNSFYFKQILGNSKK